MRMRSVRSGSIAANALWAVKALDEKSAAERLPLFEQATQDEFQLEPAVSLPVMLEGEQVINDYRYLSFSLKAHPVSFLRAEFSEAGAGRKTARLPRHPSAEE